MKTKELDKTKKIFIHIGEIDDAIIEEAEYADIVADTEAARKRYVRYGTLAAAASFGVAITTFLVLRSRRAAASTGSL